MELAAAVALTTPPQVKPHGMSKEQPDQLVAALLTRFLIQPPPPPQAPPRPLRPPPLQPPPPAQPPPPPHRPPLHQPHQPPPPSVDTHATTPICGTPVSLTKPTATALLMVQPVPSATAAVTSVMLEQWNVLLFCQPAPPAQPQAVVTVAAVAVEEVAPVQHLLLKLQFLPCSHLPFSPR